MRSWPGTSTQVGGGGLRVGAARPVLRRVDEQVRHRVGGVGLELHGRGVVGQQQQPPRTEGVEPVDQVGQDAAVPGLERLHLLLEVAGVAGLVGGLDVDQEQVGSVGQRAQGGVALALVVGVEPPGGAGHLDALDVGEHAEAADEVDRRDEPRLAAGPRREARHLRLEALAPQPHLVGRQAEPADDVAARVHHRSQLRRRRSGGPHDRLVGEVVGWRAVGVGPVGRGHEDVAVLHAGVELDLAAGAAAELGVERFDHGGRLFGGGVPAGEVDHRAVVADRRRGCSGRRRGRAAAADPARRPRWAPGRCGSSAGS